MKYPQIKKVALFGAGLMGSGWATCLSYKGIEVAVYARGERQLKAAEEKVKENFKEMVEGGLLEVTEVEEALNRISYTFELKEALIDVQLVIESITEKYDIKETAYQQIDEYCDEKVIVATSTSSLLISKLAEFSKYPERCICMHPYNPPHLIPLIELVGPENSEDAIEHIRQFCIDIDKKPVVLKKETKGFIANRMQVVIGREIVELIKRGVCTIEDCETALTFGPGMRWAVMGHNLTMQLGGGAGGVKGMFEKVVAKGSDRSSYLDDLGNWIKYPDDWPEVAQAGIDETLLNRTPEIGNDNETLEKYRNKMLIEILKLHNDVKLEKEDCNE